MFRGYSHSWLLAKDQLIAILVFGVVDDEAHESHALDGLPPLVLHRLQFAFKFVNY